MRWGFSAARRPPNILRERVQSDEDRFVRYNAAVALARRGDQAAAGTLREMLSTADLNKVIDLPGATEKQNKIEAIELEALEALRTSISDGSTGARQVAPTADHRPDQVGAGQRAKPGHRALAKFTSQALNYTAVRRSVGDSRRMCCAAPGELPSSEACL